MLDVHSLTFVGGRLPRCLVWALVVWQLFCAVPGTILPVLTNRITEVESDFPIETPSEESEPESESLKHVGIVVGRKYVGRVSGAGFAQNLTVSKQTSGDFSHSRVFDLVRNGFRACRLC